MERQDFTFQQPAHKQEIPHKLETDLTHSQGVELENHFSPQKPETILQHFDSNESQNNSNNNNKSFQEPEKVEKPEDITEQLQYQPQQKNQIISQYEKQWIMKEANMQRIGGTLDFFIEQIQKYRRHIEARKNVLESIYAALVKNKAAKTNTVIVLKQYFKDYSSICAEFHQKSYKYQLPNKDQNQSKVINIRVELKSGLQRLLTLRKDVGNKHSFLDKYINSNTIKKMQKAMQSYWGAVGHAEAKVKAKKQLFTQKIQKLNKRIDKIIKVYAKGRYGEQANEDVFVEMTKFVKEERELRCAIFDWGKEQVAFRRVIMNADYSLMVQLQSTLTEYKQFNDSIFQLKKKKYNFSDRIKQQIQKKYLYANLVLPVDNDYILGVLNYKKKKTANFLTQANYQQFLNQEYFGLIIGNTLQLLKGTIIKSFSLKNPEEEIVRSISQNFVLYNKKSLQIKNKMILANTVAQFMGNCCVNLREKVKGIIFDSQNNQKLFFESNDRAEELVMSLNAEFGKE